MTPKLVHRQSVLQLSIPINRFDEDALVDVLKDYDPNGMPAVLQAMFDLRLSDEEGYVQEPIVVQIPSLSEQALREAHAAICTQKAVAMEGFEQSQKAAAKAQRQQRRPKR